MKNIKLRIIFVIILIILGLSSVLSASTLFTSNISIDTRYPFIRSANINVSNYQISQSVTYQIEINYTVTQTSGNAKYYFKIPRINDRTPNSSLTRFCPPYQESKLLYSNISQWDPGEINEGINDEFNNTYDWFNVSLNGGISESVKISQEYIVTLNAISYQNINYSDIGTYNKSDIMFDLYCNRSEKYYNISDPDLISLSDSLSLGLTNPVDKARQIFNWVSRNIRYNGALPAQEKGASWAYDNLEGDCSEYSSLMITLLRIQGIPARKVTGLVFSNIIPFFPFVGQELLFTFGNVKPNYILGHAWVEYYVPNIGWIACDPTWGYFNQIDYLRIGFNVGQWFENATGGLTSEFPYPQLYGFGSGTVEFNYELKATVLNASYWPWILLFYFPPAPSEDQDLSIYLYVGTGAVIAIALLSTVIVLVNKERKGLI